MDAATIVLLGAGSSSAGVNGRSIQEVKEGHGRESRVQNSSGAAGSKDDHEPSESIAGRESGLFDSISRNSGDEESRSSTGAPRRGKSRTVASRYLQIPATPAVGSSRASGDRLARASSIGTATKSQSRLFNVAQARKPGDDATKVRIAPSSSSASAFKVPAPRPKIKAANIEADVDEKLRALKGTKSVSTSPINSPTKTFRRQEITSISAPSSPARPLSSIRQSIDSKASSPHNHSPSFNSPSRTIQYAKSPNNALVSPASTPSPTAWSKGLPPSSPSHNVSTTPPKGPSPTAVTKSAPVSPQEVSAPFQSSNSKYAVSPPHQHQASITTQRTPSRSSRLSHSRTASHRERHGSVSAPQSPLHHSKTSNFGRDRVDRPVAHSRKREDAGQDASVMAAASSGMSDISTLKRQDTSTTSHMKPVKEMTKQDWEILCMVLHNRALQWQFANVKARETAKAQEQHAEKQLWEALEATERLRAQVLEHEFVAKHLEVTRRAEVFLNSQEQQLGEWTAVEAEHTSALAEVLQAMLNTTLRVPLLRGAKADLEAIKTALAEMNQLLGTLTSPLAKLQPTSEKLAELMTELASTAKEERATLHECGRLLTNLSHVELHERSLRAHLIQVEQDHPPKLGGSVDLPS